MFTEINTDFHHKVSAVTMIGAAMIAFDKEDQKDIVRTVGMSPNMINVDGVSYDYYLQDGQFNFIISQ